MPGAGEVSPGMPEPELPGVLGPGIGLGMGAGIPADPGLPDCVGLLALGQPVSKAHRQASTAALANTAPLLDIICPDDALCGNWFSRFEFRPEPRAAQLAHQAVGLAIQFFVLVQPLKVHYFTGGRDTEF